MKVLLSTPLLAAALLTVWACGEDPGPTEPAKRPDLAATALAAAPTFRMVSTGDNLGCGVTSDRRGYCWGGSNSPQFVGGALRFRQVAVGGSHVCGVTTGDVVYCWGSNVTGQLGDGTTTSRLTPAPVKGTLRFRIVRAGSWHTCAVTYSNQAYCWGRNVEGQLGDSTDAGRRARPVKVVGGHSWRHVVPGGNHTCGVTNSDKGYCWGAAESGQIGDGKTVLQRRWPRAVAGGLSFRQVAAGLAHSCGITYDDRAHCWGSNGDGRIGDGTTTTRWKPVAVSGGLRFAGISPGGAHTCAVTTASRAYCWGDNAFGQLGDGTTSDRRVPAKVAGGLLIDRISAGRGIFDSFSCGLTTGDKGYCWGANAQKQLGDGTTTNRSTPVAVLGPT